MVQSAFVTDRRKGGKQREKTGRGEAEGRQEKPKTGSLNEFIEKRPGIGTDTPHHTTVETLTSPLCVSLSAITLSLPPSPPSLHLLWRCTWPLHFLSLHFLPFTPFLSPLSSFLFLLTLPDLTLVLFLSLLFCRWIVLFLLCVFLNLSLLSTAFASLLLEPFTSPFPPSSSVWFFF